MKSVTSIVALGLAVTCAAVPTTGDKPTKTWTASNGREAVSYVSKFDNANAGLLANLPVRGFSPLGPYDNLYYNLDNINVGNAVAGVKAQSAPNVLFFDALSTTTQGTPAIYSDYDDSITDYFNFKYFYFGCVLTNALDVASAPTSCTLSATGYRNGKKVASQSFDFEPTGVLVSTMTKATLNKNFANVDKVTFANNDLVANTAEAVLMDNFSYDVYLKKGKSL